MASGTLCALRSTFEFHAQWCSEVRGHTCTRLQEEVGRRRRCGERTARSQAGRSQRGVPTEDDLQLRAVQLAPVRQSHDALLVPIQSRRGHVLSRKRHMLKEFAGAICSADTANDLMFYLRNLSSLFLGSEGVIWTDQSMGSLPFCSCHRGPSARHPTPARQYSRYRPGGRWHKRCELPRW